ncbi:Zinc finger protein ZOP1 [Bienertia sinuspersici]
MYLCYPSNDTPGMVAAWEYDSTSGYYYDQHTGITYDPKSGFYYSDVLGKWVAQEEAFAAAKNSAGSKQRVPLKKPAASTPGQSTEKKGASGHAPGPVVSGSVNPKRSVKGAPSLLAVGKRKRPNEKPKVVSAEETAALKAREAARKRVEEREKSLLGLYGN